jgi:D-proline reductase (dithiol) PrdB
VEIIEQVEDWRRAFSDWKQTGSAKQNDIDDAYPIIKNRYAPFLPARRALPMLNLALISSAGAFIDGSQEFDNTSADGDFSFREIPIQVEGGDLQFAGRGYEPAAVRQDLNSQIPLRRLLEFQQNGIIGQLNPVFWSFVGFAPNAARLADEMLPKLIDRLARYEVQAALLIPASRLCHQSVSLVARAIEIAGIPTMTLAVDREIVELVRPPRAGFYEGKFGVVSGQPDWPEQQRRILDEALRLIEPMDQAGIRNLSVDIESAVEKERGER